MGPKRNLFVTVRWSYIGDEKHRQISSQRMHEALSYQQFNLLIRIISEIQVLSVHFIETTNSSKMYEKPSSISEHTQINLSEILLNQTEVRLYLRFSN